MEKASGSRCCHCRDHCVPLVRAERKFSKNRLVFGLGGLDRIEEGRAVSSGIFFGRCEYGKRILEGRSGSGFFHSGRSLLRRFSFREGSIVLEGETAAGGPGCRRRTGAEVKRPMAGVKGRQPWDPWSRSHSNTETEGARAEVERPGYFVHICGQVKEPGVYELPEGSRVYEAVEAAGGFTEEAAAEALNLAEKITDGMKDHRI